MKTEEKGWNPLVLVRHLEPFSRYSFDDWVFLVRASIIGNMIANQVTDHMRAGKGAPGGEDMSRFAKEAAAVADLWEGA
jgi:hypothetical protein